ncbi:hypothetical protein SC887_14900 [Legionella pneumophila serogroup 2]
MSTEPSFNTLFKSYDASPEIHLYSSFQSIPAESRSTFLQRSPPLLLTSAA